jgi:hypothetical protein
MLAGISYAQYEQCGEMLTEAEFEARIWVDCSTGKVTWPKSLHVEQFHFGGLQSRLQDAWSTLHSQDQTQRDLTKKVCMMIAEAIDKYVVDHLKEWR